jgi:hypothetical protein
MECVPCANAEVVNVAFPAASVPVPSVVEPSLKVAVPVGTTEPDACATVTVKAMLAPAAAELGDADKVVVVETSGAVIVRLAEVEVEEALMLSPL